MRRFLTNLDFEQQLAGRPSSQAPHHRVDWSQIWLPFVRDEDQVLLDGSRSISGAQLWRLNPELRHWMEQRDWASISADLEGRFDLGPLVSWGRCSPAQRQRLGFGAAAGTDHLSDDPADNRGYEIVRQVNRRSYRAKLEEQLRLALPGLRICHALDDLAAALNPLSALDRWVLKAEFGMAGREACRGRGPVLTAAQTGWLRKQLQTGPVVFELWLDSIGEAGVQWQIPRSAMQHPPRLGIAPLLTDQTGTYRGSLFGAVGDLAPWQTAIAGTEAVAKAVQADGYHGPLGIDVMRYRTAELPADSAASSQLAGTALRGLQDLNARWTMGRIALAWSAYLRPGECGAWIHPGRPSKHRENERDADQIAGDAADLDLNVICLPLRSGDVGSETATLTWLIIAPTPESRQRAIEQRLASHAG